LNSGTDLFVAYSNFSSWFVVVFF